MVQTSIFAIIDLAEYPFHLKEFLRGYEHNFVTLICITSGIIELELKYHDEIV